MIGGRPPLHPQGYHIAPAPKYPRMKNRRRGGAYKVPAQAANAKRAHNPRGRSAHARHRAAGEAFPPGAIRGSGGPFPLPARPPTLDPAPRPLKVLTALPPMPRTLSNARIFPRSDPAFPFRGRTGFLYACGSCGAAAIARFNARGSRDNARNAL